MLTFCKKKLKERLNIY